MTAPATMLALSANASSVSPTSSKQLPTIPHFKTQQNVAYHVYLFFHHALDGVSMANMQHLIQKHHRTTPSPTLFFFVTEMSLVFFVGQRGGATAGGQGVGWQTGDRPSSLSPPGICPLLPTFF